MRVLTSIFRWIKAKDSETAEAIERANAANIPVFTIDRSAFGGKVVLTVLANNYLAGKQEGERTSGPKKENLTRLQVSFDAFQTISELILLF